MAQTVRVCRDLTGWFATMGDEVTDYPGVYIHWELAFPDSDEAMRVFELAQDLAPRLRGETLLFWWPDGFPSLPEAPAARPYAPPHGAWHRRRAHSNTRRHGPRNR